MTSSRSTVLVAIAFGAVAGAAGALMAPHKAPETRAEPPSSIATSTAAASPMNSVAPATPPQPSGSSAPHRDFVAEAIAPLQKDPSTLQRTELGCARGNPDDCLLVGDYYARGNQNDHERRAHIYRRQAVVLYGQKCHDRWPSACRILSSLFARGIGVRRDNHTAEALLQRSLQLCRANPKRTCVRQGNDVPPDLR